jgi:type I restriction enzyme R subunit
VRCFPPAHLLDYLEHFVFYEQAEHGLRKLLAQNHQRLGVNAAVARIAAYGQLVASGADAKALTEARKLGVFWHTQGSGKSYAMGLLVRKVLRTVPGDWSFVVVTDRDDLDSQIHGNFVKTGIVKNNPRLRAGSSKALRQLLTNNERVVFTLIQKFRLEEGQKVHPVIAKSPYVVVLADEAHRSQYDTFASNMRAALPAAGFMAFTGTPLLASDTATKTKFGGYVSRYPFFQAIEDGATVPLYYEAALPELQLDDKDLDAVMDRVAKEENLSDKDKSDVEQHFSRGYILLTRSRRLEKVAEHLVDHFLGFAASMKGMVVCIDRPTTLRLARHVEAVLQRRRAELAGRLEALEAHATSQKAAMARALAELDALEWAVVVSRSPGDTDALAKQLRHHARGVVAWMKEHQKLQAALAATDAQAPPPVEAEAEAEARAEAEAEATDPEAVEARQWVEKTLPTDVETLAERFKSPTDPLRLVFVCSMWITGFDAKPCGVVYIDRPMANHTLMQTIARANRVFPGKPFGLVMDFVGVLRHLNKAFKDYEAERVLGTDSSALDSPVADKAEEIARLAGAISEAKTLCNSLGVSMPELYGDDPTKRLEAVKEATELFAENLKSQRIFRAMVGMIDRQYRALGDDPRVLKYADDRAVLRKLADALAKLDTPRDLSKVLNRLDEVLDEAMDADLDRPLVQTDRLDLGAIDAVALAEAQEALARARQKLGAAPVPGGNVVSKATIASIGTLIARWTKLAGQGNPTLLGLQQRVDQALADYTEGAKDFGALVTELLASADGLAAEAKRAESEGLSPQELAHLDVLCETLPEGGATPAVREGLKRALRALEGLPSTLSADWRNTDQGRSLVRVRCLDVLTEGLQSEADEATLSALRDALFKRLYERRAQLRHGAAAAQDAPSCDRRRAEARGYLRERPIFMGLLGWQAHEGGPFPTVAAGFSLTATSKRSRGLRDEVVRGTPPTANPPCPLPRRVRASIHWPLCACRTDGPAEEGTAPWTPTMTK